MTHKGAPVPTTADQLTIAAQAREVYWNLGRAELVEWSISQGEGELSADGALVGQVGLFQPVDSTNLKREAGVLLDAPDGFELTEAASVKQGFVEGSNVDPITQVARMIEVQRAYEMGQSFLDSENERVRAALETFLR